jgi:chromosome segregation ATPase
MELSKETRDRIFAAADSLYEQAGRDAFPTVDAVRKTARVNMNDASVGMREWRRAQTVQAAPAAVHVPETVRQAGSAMLATLWQEAQALANESLRAAQAVWDAERTEAETLNKQMADAYESQAADLEIVRTRIAELEASVRQALEETESHRKLVEEARTALIDVQQRAATAEARAAELRTELDYAHREVREAHQEARKAHAELAKTQTRADAERAAYQEPREAMTAELHEAKT